MGSTQGSGINRLNEAVSVNSRVANCTLAAITLILLLLAFINPVRSRLSAVSVSTSGKFSSEQLSSLIAGEQEVRPFSSCYVSSVEYNESRSDAAINAAGRLAPSDNPDSDKALIESRVGQGNRLAMLRVTMPCNLLSPSDNFDHVSWYMLADDGRSWTLLGKN